LIWAVVVTAASVQDRDGALRVFNLMEANDQRLQTVFADGSYAGNLEGVVFDLWGWNLTLVKKPDTHKGFVVLPKRWIVERTFAWLSKYRRLHRDYEFLPATSEAMIKWAMVHQMAGKLANT
jgi:transposase